MKTVIILSLLFSFATQAKILEERVESIDLGGADQETLILLESGEVIFTRDRELVSDKSLKGSKVRIEFDKNHNLRSISSLPDEEGPEEFEAPLARHEAPTVLENYDAAYNIFRGMNTSWYNKSECTDRAQVWTYEEWKKRGLISQKIFMFFTRTYIRRYRYHWWFHVTPTVLVKTGQTETGEPIVEEKMMDRRYSRGPLSRKTWSDIFIRSKKACPVTTYRHYRENKYGPEHCFHVKSAMYYRLPLHVRALEDQGRVKTRFSTGEVNFSYRAFRRRGVK
jgi:hypothetical protein